MMVHSLMVHHNNNNNKSIPAEWGRGGVSPVPEIDESFHNSDRKLFVCFVDSVTLVDVVFRKHKVITLPSPLLCPDLVLPP